MKQAEQNDEFVFKETKSERAVNVNEEEEDEDESDNNYEDDESDKKNEDSISNLAKQLLKSKLEKPEPVTLKKPTTPTISKKNDDQDDLDLELDMDLENVDTTDVNLDDDISD